MDNFIKKEDYLQCVDDKTLLALTQGNDDKLNIAERTAIDEVIGYLDKYDTTQLFSKQGNERPDKLVGVICDIALYHLASSTSGRMGYETRKERFDVAISWLKSVQSGRVTPAKFPLKETQKDNASVMQGGENPNSWLW